MSSRAAAIVLALLASSCDDTLFRRAGQEYFPLIPGSTWKFLSDADTVLVQVDTVDVSLQGRPCRVVYRNFAPEYWVRSATEARRFSVLVSGRPNYEDTLEARFGLVLQFPLVLGATWGEIFRDTIVLRGGDTVRFRHQTTGRVAGLGTVRVPAGNFADCYEIELWDEVIGRDSVVTTTRVWLAPGVGIIRREQGADVEQLIEYRPGR